MDCNGNYKYYELSNLVSIGVPIRYELLQNYPNPFNPSTTIKYTIPNDNFVQIKIYDLKGSEVSTLVNEFKKAGYYQIQLNATMLSSGMYFYKMTTDNFNSTKKMILIK